MRLCECMCVFIDISSYKTLLTMLISVWHVQVGDGSTKVKNGIEDI